jgi:hypothetical protein
MPVAIVRPSGVASQRPAFPPLGIDHSLVRSQADAQCASSSCQWKRLVLEPMRAFRGEPTETMVNYLCVVMPGVWSELLAAHAV